MIGADDRALRERFFAVAEEEDDSNWDDVLARAGVNGPPSRKRMVHPRVLLALGAAFVLGLGLTAALGVSLRPAAAAAPPGPKRVERHVGNGTVSWLFRHERRGESLAAEEIALGSTVGAHWQPVKFARVITPDDSTNAKIVLSLIGKHGRNICITVVLAHSGGGGCAVGLLLRPFTLMTMGGMDFARTGGVVLAGVASDDVARMELFLPRGRHRRVPLKDNAFLVSVTATNLPSTLVAYDSDGVIIGRTVPHLIAGLR